MGKDLKGRELGQYLSQRKDGRYQARFTDRFGKRQEKKSKSLKEVKEWLKEEKAKDTLALNQKRTDETVDIWYHRWKNRAFVDLAVGTQKIYVWAYNYCIYPHYGNVKVTDINEYDLEGFFQKLKDSYDDGSISSVKSVFSQIMQCCKQAKYIPYNPVKEVKLKKRKKQEIDSKALTIREQNLLFEYLKGHLYYNFFAFCLNTGLRYGEAAALTKKDIDLDRKVVHITKSLKYRRDKDLEAKYDFYFGTTKTESSVRIVPLNETACETIKRQMVIKERIEKSKYADTNVPHELKKLLFVTGKNLPISGPSLDSVLRNARFQINYQLEEEDYMIQLSVHRLRHTFATRCYENGIPMKIISKYLGHSSVLITEKIYIHLLKEHMDLQAEKLETIQTMEHIQAVEDFDIEMDDLLLEAV